MTLRHPLLLPALLAICLLPAETLLGQSRAVPFSTLSSGFSAAGRESGGMLVSSVGPDPAGISSGSSHRLRSGFLAASRAFTGGHTRATIAVEDGWNMVSVPLTVAAYAQAALFPTATSGAFAFEGGYVLRTVLSNGAGYWLKFDSSHMVGMTGLARNPDTVAVQTGWNLIGSISSAVPAGSVGSIPGGIVVSPFFGYVAGAYGIASSIDPGRGYWVKVSQDGRLLLARPVETAASPPR
jgi:hypothetical protein